MTQGAHVDECGEGGSWGVPSLLLPSSELGGEGGGHQILVSPAALGGHRLLLSVQTNENMEITSTLQTEQYVKKELAKKLGQLQEKLGELKETVTLPQLRRAQSRALASGAGGTWARMS